MAEQEVKTVVEIDAMSDGEGPYVPVDEVRQALLDAISDLEFSAGDEDTGFSVSSYSQLVTKADREAAGVIPGAAVPMRAKVTQSIPMTEIPEMQELRKVFLDSKMGQPVTPQHMALRTAARQVLLRFKLLP